MLRMSVISKSAMVATVLALALATFSATSVFAASSTTPHAKALSQDLTSTWKDELRSLRMEQFVYSHMGTLYRNWLKDNSSLTSADKGLANQDISKFVSYLNQAEAIVGKHSGFSASGVAIDNIQATKSANELSSYLHDLNMVLSHKIESLF
jgi:hypothetical protein